MAKITAEGRVELGKVESGSYLQAVSLIALIKLGTCYQDNLVERKPVVPDLLKFN